jgi:hypothetical protein
MGAGFSVAPIAAMPARSNHSLLIFVPLILADSVIHSQDDGGMSDDPVPTACGPAVWGGCSSFFLFIHFFSGDFP